GGKEGLVAALQAEGFRRFAAAMVQMPRRRDPLRSLTEGCVAYRDWALANRAYYRVMFGRGIVTTAPDAPASFARLVDGVTAAQASGRLRAGDPWRLAHVIWGVLHGHVSLELASITAPGPGGAAAEEA